MNCIYCNKPYKLLGALNNHIQKSIELLQSKLSQTDKQLNDFTPLKPLNNNTIVAKDETNKLKFSCNCGKTFIYYGYIKHINISDKKNIQTQTQIF
jgi:acetone carboxylase gamma subunit